MATVVLASGSPQRLALVGKLGLEPTVVVPGVDESQLPDEPPDQYVRRVSLMKAEAISDDDGVVIIAADTIAVVDGLILGKPINGQRARSMLESLSGRWHQAVTGVSVRAGSQTRCAVVVTEVEFVDLSHSTIAWYITTGEPFDKAGGYAIQGRGAAFVRRVRGSVSNVIGLPLAETADLLTEVGCPIDTLRPR